MVTPLLATKLYSPPARPDFVKRPRLMERLDEGMLMQNESNVRDITLVSAPSGFDLSLLTTMSHVAGEKTLSSVALVGFIVMSMG